jgi:hypothetical protein
MHKTGCENDLNAKRGVIAMRKLMQESLDLKPQLKRYAKKKFLGAKM